MLVTNFLIPPPLPNMQTEWNLLEVNPKDALLQKILLADILDCRWQVYRSEGRVRSLLKAGFNQIEILYDKAHIFPTVVAHKSF